MTSFRRFGLVSLVLLGLAGSIGAPSDALAGGTTPAGKGAPKPLPPPPAVKETIRLTPEGLHFGMSVAEVIDFYNKVFDQDYVPIYKQTPIGPKLKEVDAALA